MVGDDVISAWAQHAGRCIGDMAVFDSHLHVGEDRDGMLATPEELVQHLHRCGAEGGFVFALDDVHPGPSFRTANDRVLNVAAQADPALRPLGRIDLADSPSAEARRCLRRGFAGFKVHARAQGASLGSPAMADLVAIAESARVPVVIHAGKGMAPFAADLRGLARRHPEARLILAHAALGDQRACLEMLGPCPGVSFDTSVWSPADLLSCIAFVGPHRVLFGSDWPYGQQPAALLLAFEVMQALSLGREAMSDVFAGNAARLVSRDPLPPVDWTPKSVTVSRSSERERLLHLVALVFASYWADRSADHQGLLSLAAHAARTAAGSSPRLAETLDAASRAWRAIDGDRSGKQRRTLDRRLSALLHLALLAAWIPEADSDWSFEEIPVA